MIGQGLLRPAPAPRLNRRVCPDHLAMAVGQLLGSGYSVARITRVPMGASLNCSVCGSASCFEVRA